MKLLPLLTALLLAAAPLAAQMNYQGRLTGPNGAELTDASATLTFHLYSAGGDVRWGPFLATVPLTEGRFNVILGPNDTTGKNINTAFTTIPPETANPARYLGIKVGDATTDILPRQQILAAPIALHAHHATNADTASNFTSVVLKTDEINQRVGIGLSNPAEKLDVAGNVKVSGDLTASGNVGIGLPPNPAKKLDVAGDSKFTGAMQVTGIVNAGDLVVSKSFQSESAVVVKDLLVGKDAYITGNQTVVGALTAATLNGEKPPMVYKCGDQTLTDNSKYYETVIPASIVQSYLGDENGGRIRINLRSNTNAEGYVRTIEEIIYMEQNDVKQSGVGIYGHTLGTNGIDSAYILGGGTRYEIIPNPFGAIWIRNYNTGGAGLPISSNGLPFTGADTYKLVILTGIGWSATVIVYDR